MIFIRQHLILIIIQVLNGFTPDPADYENSNKLTANLLLPGTPVGRLWTQITASRSLLKEWADFERFNLLYFKKPARYRRAVSYDSKEYYMRLASGNPAVFQDAIEESSEGEAAQQEPEHGEDTIARVKGWIFFLHIYIYMHSWKANMVNIASVCQAVYANNMLLFMAWKGTSSIFTFMVF